ncbi:MAG: hypothetical protein OXK17_01190 [Thaumarchaeota archaeon]|nr:hypothetical protein [Nitrososphaerota archaeon]
MKRAKRTTRDLQLRQKHYEADVKFRILHLFERGDMPPEGAWHIPHAAGAVKLPGVHQVPRGPAQKVP